MDKDIWDSIKAEIKRGHNDLKAINEWKDKMVEKIESLIKDITTNTNDIGHIKELFNTRLIDIKEELNNKIGKIQYDFNGLGAKLSASNKTLRAFKGWMYVLIIGLLMSLVGNLILFILSRGG